ncbi:MAG: hypothetical protein J6P73_01530 [Bacteroidales bacterium]|nr:hypothetical protein [Bacteroidales bacterium]
MNSLLRKMAVVTSCIALFAINTLMAQTDCATCNKIRGDASYYWAESPSNDDGSFVSFSEARDAAVAQLVKSISSQIKFDASVYIQVVDGVTTKVYDRVLNSYSNVIVEDLTTLELSPEPHAKVFCYVEKDKVTTIFEERANQIHDFIASGKHAEQNLQIDDAIRFYYWALMLSTSLPKNIEVEFNGQKGYAVTVLPTKIRSVLAGLDCKLQSIEENDFGEQVAMLTFTYCGEPVSSLRFKYFNGESTVGPVHVKDGKGEVVLVELPPDGKMDIYYEYLFMDEAKQLIPEIYENLSPVVIMETKASCQVGKQKKKEKKKEKTEAVVPIIKQEAPNNFKSMDLEKVDDDQPYLKAMNVFEDAIRKQTPVLAKPYMTNECYKLFEHLLTKTGKLTLTKQEDYEFLYAKGQILGRFIYVKLKVGGGKEFMDKLVFRFSPEDHLAHSFAFGLTELAEANIFDSAKNWSSISRFTILGFMEDYQTAFALKRLDYIRQIFSDDAVIIVGNELQTTTKGRPDVVNIQLDSEKKIVYNKYTKQQYIDHLQMVFDKNRYIHLTFEDNTTRILNTNGVLPDGMAFGIQIKQMYNSSQYSDRGYLTLMMRMDLADPIIVVRYWQPDKEEMIDIGQFFDNKNFEW